jgi:hypothetical protein
MAETTYFDMTYPDENEDPYFDSISSFFTQLDQNLFAFQAIGQPILGGGAVICTNLTVPPNPYTAQLTWSQPFEFIIPGSGFSFYIPYGPDNATASILLEDGDRIIVAVPYISSQNITGFFKKINGATVTQPQQGLFTLGVYRAGMFYSNIPVTFPARM